MVPAQGEVAGQAVGVEELVVAQLGGVVEEEEEEQEETLPARHLAPWDHVLIACN